MNFHEMILTGDTTWNIPVYNNCFIYVPPTFIGGIARFIERALAPLRSIVNTLIGVAIAQDAYEFVFEGNDGRRFRGF